MNPDLFERALDVIDVFDIWPHSAGKRRSRTYLRSRSSGMDLVAVLPMRLRSKFHGYLQKGVENFPTDDVSAWNEIWARFVLDHVLEIATEGKDQSEFSRTRRVSYWESKP
jgi:hypothetical protein